jgi:hypothetical protein
VGRREDAEPGRVEEADLPQVDAELADLGVEERIQVLAEQRCGGRVDLAGPVTELSMVTSSPARGSSEGAVTECLSGGLPDQ